MLCLVTNLQIMDSIAILVFHHLITFSGDAFIIAQISVYGYALFCIFCCHRANWHSPSTLTEVCPCFFLSCKANARVYFEKTGHGPHSS